MKRTTTRWACFVLTLVAGLVLSGQATAQATRTWVSGVGDDANPCSRTAPCKTFAGAISKTAPAGEINVLDPGGFGAVTITKSITISSEGFEAGVLVSGTNGIIVNAASTDVVVLRGLDFEGLGTGLAGIRFLAGGALFVEKCTINHFINAAIDFEPNQAANSQLYVTDTIVRNNVGAAAGGVLVKPAGGGTATASLDGVRMEKNQFGFRSESNTGSTVRNSIVTGNVNAGILGTLGAVVSVDNTVSSFNANGIRADAGATVNITDCTVTNNTTQGLNATGGAFINTWGNNHVANNVSNGTATPISPI